MSKEKIHWKNLPKLTSIGSYEVCLALDGMVESIDRYIDNYNLNLFPDFQRGHVWRLNQQVKYLEFLLKAGQTNNVLYFNHPNWMGSFKGEFVIVDGLQRLTAILDFLNDKFPVFNNKYYSSDINLSNHHNLRINVNNLKTRKEVLQWYLEINSNGTPHTEIEINKVKDLLKKEIESEE